MGETTPLGVGGSPGQRRHVPYVETHGTGDQKRQVQQLVDIRQVELYQDARQCEDVGQDGGEDGQGQKGQGTKAQKIQR